MHATVGTNDVEQSDRADSGFFGFDGNFGIDEDDYLTMRELIRAMARRRAPDEFVVVSPLSSTRSHFGPLASSSSESTGSR